MTKKTTQQQFIESSQVLYLAFELSNKKWKLGFSIGLGQKVRIRTIDSGNLAALRSEIQLAAKRFKLTNKFQVVSCYEAGRDGFWIHRFLASEGIQNFVVDSASIEVNRRKRRKKSDKLDVNSLVRMLIRYSYGDRKVWSVLAIPSAEDEDRRQLHRELSSLEKEKKRTSNRIRGLLATQGIRVSGTLDLSEENLDGLRTWDKQALGRGLKDRIRREWGHLVFIMEQILDLTRERQKALKQKNPSREHPDTDKIQQLHKLRAIGPVGAWTLTREFFGWRHFKNRRQVGSLAGLASAHYQSGDTDYDQGISKAGVVPVR
jgi:transposase